MKRGEGWLVSILALAVGIVLTAVIITALRPPTAQHGAAPLAPGASASSSPAATPSTRQSASEVLAKARPLIIHGEFAKAASMLQRASEDWPRDREIRLQLAAALQSLQRWPEARQQIEAAIAIGPTQGADGAAMHIQAGTIANREGLLEQAIEHYQAAMRLEPTQARHPLFLAMIQIKQGQDDAAIASLAKAVRLDENLGEAWGTLAELELRRNNVSMAAQHIAKARAAQPEFVKWRVVHARIFRRQGDPAAAVALLENLPEAERTTMLVGRDLAESLSMLGQHAKASAALERVAAAPATPPDQRAILLLDAALAAQRAGDLDRAKHLAAKSAQLGHDPATRLIGELASQPGQPVAPPPGNTP
jgi:tetratricopeptide (TPR) repeat protein